MRTRLLLLVLLVCCSPLAAEDAPGSFPWLDPAGIRGSLVIVGGGEQPEVIHNKFIELAGGKEARLIVIPTASGSADEVVADPEQAGKMVESWKSRGAADVHVVHTRSKEQANDDAFVAPL